MNVWEYEMEVAKIAALLATRYSCVGEREIPFVIQEARMLLAGAGIEEPRDETEA